MNSMNILDEMEAISPSAISLTDDQIEQAIQHNKTIKDPAQQWQLHLNSLTLLGFEQWLNQRASDVSINSSQNSLMQLDKKLPVVCNVIVNDFKICLIPVESQPDEVELPSRVIASPELVAHFYVTVAVYEEQSRIAVHSFLRYDQLVAQIQLLQPDLDQFYYLSINHFDPNLNRLIFYLRCSHPSAILLPDRQQAPGIPYSSFINVYRWLQNELDERAQQLSWVLLPPPTVANAMRLTARVVNQPTPQESFDSVIKQLVREGMTLPSDARVAYQDLNPMGVAAWLYVLVGTLPSNSTPEWTMLFVLVPSPEPETPLPRGIQLQVSVSDTPLTQQTLTQQEDDYLYTQVTGTLEEQFCITITAPGGSPITFSPFAFQTND